jgi:hypothetical protein
MDFIIPWVDNSDPEWRKEFNKYKAVKEDNTDEYKFRDWDNLKYWFRGIEKFAPWVDQIHFVTCGHLPEWLHTEHPKLNVVKHEDYIPEKYLPTFSSHTIELNFHRIKELSEEYVYFNDDTFVIDYVKEEYFFKNGRPCDMAVSVIFGFKGAQFDYIKLNDISFIDKHFKNKYKTILSRPFHWVNWKYKLKYNLKNILLLAASPRHHTGLLDFHLPQPHKKSTLKLLWEKEWDLLDQTCTHTFRSFLDINQYVQRYWDLVTNNFKPIDRRKLGKLFAPGKKRDLQKASEFIKQQKKPMICVNDHEDILDFEEIKKEINAAFEAILPDKCSFEN